MEFTESLINYFLYLEYINKCLFITIFVKFCLNSIQLLYNILPKIKIINKSMISNV